MKTAPPLPLARPDVTRAEIDAVLEVLESDTLSIGPRIQAFEAAFAERIGARHAVGVSSGTAGLHVALEAAGVDDGDLVVTTPFSFVASSNAILFRRATPVFVDVDEGTLNIDPAAVAGALDDLAAGGAAARDRLPPAARDGGGGEGRGAAAVLPVDIFGQPAAMEAIVAAARRHGAAVIEDACEAVGATRNGREAGSFGDASVFAFYPNKQMTTGEGGMVLTDREDWAETMRSLRNQGRGHGGSWLDHERLGYNYRMDELSAALGLVQLRRLDELVSKRQAVADRYAERLAGVDEVRLLDVDPATTRMSWFVYVVRLADGIDRDAVSAALAEDGIPTRPYFAPIHLQPFYRQRFGFRGGEFPVTERAGRSALALPFFGQMTGDEVDRVCDRLIAALRSAR